MRSSRDVEQISQAQFYQHLRHLSAPQSNFRDTMKITKCSPKKNKDLNIENIWNNKYNQRPKTARIQWYSRKISFLPQLHFPWFISVLILMHIIEKGRISSATIHGIINKDEDIILENSAKYFGKESVAYYSIQK